MTNLFSLICSPFCRAAAVALPGLLNHLYIRLLLLTVSPRKRSAAEHDIRHGAALLPGGGWRLTRPTVRSSQPLTYPLVRLKLPVLRPQCGLNIAETFPAGRGSPHGCGLRAVFCMDAASARPEACRDKSKAPRSGDVAGRSPGVQGAAATGRPLCAPCAMIDITQTISRERKLR